MASSDYLAVHSTSVYLIRRAFRTLIDAEYGSSLPLAKRNDLFEEKVAPSTLACRLVGSMYTAAVYVNLASMLSASGPKACGKSVLVYSYGSGLAASLYRLKVHALPSLNGFIADQLAESAVTLVDPKDFVAICEEFSAAVTASNFTPRTPSPLKPDTFFLERIDAGGLRHYALQQ